MSLAWERRQELKSPEKKAERLARIEELEQEVFERAAGVVTEILAFREVKHDQKQPPPEWIEQFGEDDARKKLEIAKAGWLPQSIAPAGFKYAVQVMAGISRARQYKVKLTQNNLNVKIALPAPTSAAHPGPVTYEVRDLEQ